MSEPKLITPLLDDHIMGDPISDHHGVRCCPAMHSRTEEKLMVKIISIPASQTQLDALLLSGAYPNAEAANGYFLHLAEETVEEARLLQELSRLEGFCGYTGWQMVPMEEGVGYDVYLVGPYGMTLERYLRRNTMTLLGAVNLGLDLCAALSVSRRNGWLYVDLQPENILLSDAHGYRICDLGFIRLDSLKYASLPDKYRSAYTPPEITDAFASLNTTMDIYAAGMILYQIFNDGRLPEPGSELLPPTYADYEMAQIILKACAADPADRWQDPQQMGQALIGYMQRNTVNDVPIIPPPLPVEQPAPAEEVSDEVEHIDPSEPVSDEAVEVSDEIPGEEVAPVEDYNEIALPAEEHPADGSVEEDPPAEAVPDEDVPVEPVAEETDELPPADAFDEDPEQFVIDGFDSDVNDADAYPDAVVTDEVSSMLAQADELIAHQTPDPVVAPEPIEVPMPPPILPEPEPEEEPAPADEMPAETAEEDLPPEEPAEDPEPVADMEEPEALPETTRRKCGWLKGLIAAILILGILVGGCALFYYEYYLQDIRDLTLSGSQDRLTVTIDTDIDQALLSVTCTDTYGNKLTQPVVDGKAHFHSLPSGTTYKVAVVIAGTHKLTGDITATYSTAPQTTIVNFNAITGDTDGSVILNFSVQGPDSEQWQVRYAAEGETPRTADCTGHTALITGLTPGATYTFRLIPKEDLYINDTDTLRFTASRVIYARDLTIHGFHEGHLLADWSAPEGVEDVQWTVRCYNNTGFDTTYTVNVNRIAIEGLDMTQGYTIDVKAAGMTVSRWTSISPNSITFKQMLVDDSVPGKLTLTWSYEGTAPAEGWDLIYTVNGANPVTVLCTEPTFTLSDLIPGAEYYFRFDLPTGLSVFGGTARYTVPAAEAFAGYGVTIEHLQIKPCRAPDKEDWDRKDLSKSDYTTAFTSGEKAGLVLRLLEEYNTSKDEIRVLFLITDASGNIHSVHTFTDTWTNLWYRGYCELDLPALPTAPGTYGLQIFFNGAYLNEAPISFTVQ